MSERPTGVEPVKVSLRRRGSRMSGSMTSPVVACVVMTTLSTPSGSPHSRRRSARASIVRGVWLAGLTTIVQPAAMAGPILRVPIASGKFHGVIIRRRADGLLHRHEPGRAVGGRRPATRDAHGLLGEPAEELGAVGDLTAALGERLAHLEGHEHRELLRALGDLLVGRPQQLAAVARRRARPVGLRRHGGVEGGPAVGDRSRRDVGQHPAARRVVDRDGLSVAAVAPLPADEQALGHRVDH